MSKSYHKQAKKFDDDYEDDDVETKKKIDRFTRQLKKLKLEENRDHDT